MLGFVADLVTSAEVGVEKGITNGQEHTQEQNRELDHSVSVNYVSDTIEASNTSDGQIGDSAGRINDRTLTGNNEETPIPNPMVQGDLRIVGRFWGDAEESESESESCTPTQLEESNTETAQNQNLDGFQVVLSKSQRKRQRKQAKRLNTRVRGGPGLFCLMKILFWNIRGVGKQDSRLTLEKLCKSHKPNFLFIAEPWISTSQIPISCLQRLNLKIFAVNNRAQLISNLWCLCSHNYSPNIIASSLQFVALSIPIGDQLICVAAVYASTNYIARRDLWEDLAQLQQSYVNPWCFIGDFNAILGAHE